MTVGADDAGIVLTDVDPILGPCVNAVADSPGKPELCVWPELATFDGG